MYITRILNLISWDIDCTLLIKLKQIFLRFFESNKRVEEYIGKIYEALERKDDYGYKAARQFAGNILHTIHDFYSHTNWVIKKDISIENININTYLFKVEMGRRDLNPHIGKISFTSLDIVTEQDDRTCYDNCDLVRKECGALGIISSAIWIFKKSLKCPLKYYNCTNNIVYTKKLISGFYVDQKMYGTEIVKPQNRKKCSHGNQNGTFIFLFFTSLI